MAARILPLNNGSRGECPGAGQAQTISAPPNPLGFPSQSVVAPFFHLLRLRHTIGAGSQTILPLTPHSQHTGDPWALPSPIEPDSSLPQHPCHMALASDSPYEAPTLSLHSTGEAMKPSAGVFIWLPPGFLAVQTPLASHSPRGCSSLEGIGGHFPHPRYVLSKNQPLHEVSGTFQFKMDLWLTYKP